MTPSNQEPEPPELIALDCDVSLKLRSGFFSLIHSFMFLAMEGRVGEGKQREFAADQNGQNFFIQTLLSRAAFLSVTLADNIDTSDEKNNNLL